MKYNDQTKRVLIERITMHKNYAKKKKEVCGSKAFVVTEPRLYFQGY